MARQPTRLTPWQEMEQQAYHAYREWPLFLKLRLRALRRHLPPEAFASESPGQHDAPEKDAVAADIALLAEYGLMVPGEAVPDG
jgi:hypothetical protein